MVNENIQYGFVLKIEEYASNTQDSAQKCEKQYLTKIQDTI